MTARERIAEGKMSDYTKGWLRVAKRGARWMEIANQHGGRICEIENEANARRLVACWNVCDGIQTEDLEGGTTVAYILHLEGQCAELIEALRLVIRSIGSDEFSLTKEQRRDMDTVRVLLAKHSKVTA